MINLTDEILNKYIDNELSSSELTEIKIELNKSEEALSRLRALRLVDNSLRKIAVETAPVNLTEKIMDVLRNAPKALKPKGSYFFALIMSVFSLSILAIFIAAFKLADDNGGSIIPVTILNNAKSLVDKNVNTLQSFFTNQNVVLIISTLSLILLLAVYFSIEAHKNFKNKLDSIPH